MEKQEIKKYLKTAKIDKSKKWMYNYAHKIIELYEQGAETHRFNRITNNYHKQHYEQYFTKVMRERKHKNLDRRKPSPKLDKKILDRQRELQKTMRNVYQLYKTGQLSSQSTKVTEKELQKLKKKTGNKK